MNDRPCGCTLCVERERAAKILAAQTEAVADHRNMTPPDRYEAVHRYWMAGLEEREAKTTAEAMRKAQEQAARDMERRATDTYGSGSGLAQAPSEKTFTRAEVLAVLKAKKAECLSSSDGRASAGIMSMLIRIFEGFE